MMETDGLEPSDAHIRTVVTLAVLEREPDIFLDPDVTGRWLQWPDLYYCYLDTERDAVMRLLMQCRSKGARVVVAMQDVEACARVYGSREQAFSLLKNCASLCFTAPLTHLTETYMKAAMGSQ